MSVSTNSIDLNIPTKNRLTHEQRQDILAALLKQSENGVLKAGSTSEIAIQYSVSIVTIRRIWYQEKASFNCNGSFNVSNNMVERVGRKRIQIIPSVVSQIPLRRRTNIRSMAIALNMSRATLHRRIQEGCIRPHSNALKPVLTDANKKARLQFCLSMLEPSSINNTPIFTNMFNYVHIDEKWFYMTKESQKFYLLPEEEEPIRTCKSKRFITKVMFLAVVARPRFDSSNNLEFSGKIGIFPFTFKEPAKRNSMNRVAGTLETKSIMSITKDVVRDCLIQKVLPAIRTHWPPSSRMDTIFIQQDNAKPHIKSDDTEFLQAASIDGFDIRLYFQPPNSPDFNILHLGFFQAIQSLQHQEAPTTIDELIQAVEKAFNDLSAKSLNYVFLTFQSCMIETMKDRGGNGYKVPHLGKERLEREGNLPLQLEVEQELLKSVLT